MTLGIWTTDESLENQKKLYDEGFRGATIGDPYQNISWEEAAYKMYHERYLPLKEIGYTHFLIQMRSVSSEYHDAVLAKFKDCPDVEYLFGEPFDLVEKQGWKEIDLYNFLYHVSEKIYAIGKELIVDIQLRLWNKFNKLTKKVPSSYFWQQRVWYKDMPFAWIYGQLAWHSFIPFIGSLCYKRLKRKADKLGITVAYLYVGDTDKFSNLINGFLRKRFVKIFGEKQ